jgi:flagellar M-ring protein FliF
MIEQLTTLVRQLTISQRIGIVFGSLMSVLLLVGLVMWAGQPQMVPAFNNLAAKDAESITAALDSAGIPYELAAGGAVIKVPSAELSNAKVAAGAAGYSPDGTTGMEIFDNPGFGASEFDQQVAYQRATQGELERQLMDMEGVQDAQVTIVAADKGVLSSDDQAASASVYIKMAGNRTPDAALVQGIAGLVSGAVAGLTPKSVTIVNADGTVLWGPNNASSTALTIQGTVERATVAKAQAYLMSILGLGKSSVAVTAELDLDQVEKTVRSYQVGEGNPAVSTQWNREIVANGAANGVAGIPGTTSNVPGIPAYPNASPAASPAASIPSDYVKEGATINYANTETVAQITQVPGTVKRLSVAVLVDQDALTATGISAENLNAGLMAAVGAVQAADPANPVAGERNDTFQVLPAKFPTADPAAAAGGMDIMKMAGEVIPTVAGGMLALVLLFLVWRNMKALRGRAEDMQLLAARMNPAQLGAGELAMAGGHLGYGDSELPELTPMNSPQAKVQERIRLMAEERPEELAGLVNTWLHEDEKGRRR